MMLNLTGYKFTQELSSGLKTTIYRGIREADQKPAIAKVLTPEYPPLEEIARLRQEYLITQKIKSENIVKSYALEIYQNSYALILEDVKGKSLKELLDEGELRLREILRIVISLAETLGELHAIPVLHKDIKCSNIIVNDETGQVKITDFGIASQLSRENPSISSPKLLEGTLAYMSPEQTGRMNRAIDYRTDYYALGATLYEMLAGQVPFVTNDPMELVHCHLAKEPVPPGDLNLEVPEAVSDIAMKLLAKTAEERYQSAAGLIYDLEKCLNQLQTDGTIEAFPLGERDRGSQLLIPEKLYGRDREVVAILDAFDRVSGLGRGPDAGNELVTDAGNGWVSDLGNGWVADVTVVKDVTAGAGGADAADKADKGRKGEVRTGPRSEMVLVSGYSGIGKTAIVNEVHKPIVRARGYFIAGKFDQFQRDIPYAAMIQAFAKLVRQILTESSEQIEVWKARLLKALGSNGQAIVEVIPELELIIGQQPELPKLGPTESQNRFNRLFQEFIGVFTQKQHPLVLFLDDLQWADSASLKLLELLMADPERQYLLLIGAYRDNEVSPTHPLIGTLERIQESGAAVNNINVGPLQRHHVRELLAETLGEEDIPETVPIRSVRRKSKSAPLELLTDLLFQKTQGNPFFLTQLLKTLYAESLLLYDAGNNSWRWDIEEIQAVGIADYGIVELIARNLQKLPAETQNLLRLAACIGNQFNLEVLAVAAEKSQTITAAYLWEALQGGTILPLSDTYKIPLVLGETETEAERPGLRDVHVDYKFLHDRVQQAAYSLIPEAEKKETHLRIGQLLLEETTEEERKENIFALVNQLNYGTDLLTQPREKEELAELNLMAGQKAKASAAYQASFNYLELGLGLLAVGSWQRNYELSRELHVEALEAAYLNGNFDRATALATVAEQEASNLLDKVRVNELKMPMYVAQNQIQEALDTGLSVLQLLEVSLEESPPKDLVVEDCYDLPEMSDTYKLAAVRILMILIVPAYVMNQEVLLGSIIFTIINLSLIYGNAPSSAFGGYCMYGVILCDSLVEIEAGYRYGRLAMGLLDKFASASIKVKVTCEYNGYIRYCKEHIRETIDPLQDTVAMGLECGDLEFAGYASVMYCGHLTFSGEHLELVAQKSEEYGDWLQKLKQAYSVVFPRICQQMALNLLGQAEDKRQLSGTALKEAEMRPVLLESNNATTLFWLALAKIMLLYLFKDAAGAALEAREAEQYAHGCAGMFVVPEHNFYYSLALLAQYPGVNKEEQEEFLEQVAANQEKMKIWSDHGSMNFQHKYDLVEAEKARVLGDEVAAINRYDRAIDGARKERFTQEEALANELAGEFHLERGREGMGKFYLIEAYYGYVRWGALAKAEDLEQRYPEYLSRIQGSQSADFEVTRTATMKTTTAGSSGVLDFPSILKASQAISGEIVQDKLLKTLIEIVIENAGAQLGILVLKREEQMVVEAVGMVGDRDGVQDVYGICDSDSQENEYISTICASKNLDNNKVLPLSLVNYVARTQKNVVLNNATVNGSAFTTDPYIQKNQVKSVLCAPIIDRGQFIGVIYLENNLIEGAFTSDRVKVLNLLCSQAAISLQNARLYENLKESEGRERDKAVELEQYLTELKQAQLQLVQSEKMSTLGELVAGVAHEINNPVSFIAGNIDHAEEYSEDLIKILRLYRQHYPNPVPEIEAEIEASDLEYLVEDLPELISSMKAGTDRIRNISTSLRTFSRSDVASKVEFNIHDGLDSTLMILKHRLKANEKRPEIEVVKAYGELPNILCYPGQINQVFMNILANGIDALEEYNQGRDYEEMKAHPNKVTISTEVSPDGSIAVIRIKDNGPGIPQEVQEQLFEHLFTTKPVGKGTGLGLSISRQIVEEKHGGKLSVSSASGEGAEFIIEVPL